MENEASSGTLLLSFDKNFNRKDLPKKKGFLFGIARRGEGLVKVNPCLKVLALFHQAKSLKLVYFDYRSHVLGVFF